MIVNRGLCDILQVLYKQKGPLKAGEISKIVGISQPLSSQRLNTLKKYKLVTSKKVANVVYYEIDKINLIAVENLIEAYNGLQN